MGESNCLIPTSDDGVVYISNFDETFYSVVYQAFDNDDNKNSLNNPDLLPALYVETLVRKNANNSKSFVQPNADLSDEMLHSLIAYIYFAKTGTFDDFVDYLKDRKETDKILGRLQDESRFDAYNYLLKTITDYLSNNDLAFYKR